jgi:hypothetical protein
MSRFGAIFEKELETALAKRRLFLIGERSFKKRSRREEYRIVNG